MSIINLVLRFAAVLALSLSLLAPSPLLAGDAPVFESLSVLNTQAPGQTGLEWNADVASDGKGKWLAVWHSTNTLGDKIGRDWDILVAGSTDAGMTWSAPRPLNSNAAKDSGNDRSPVVMSAGKGAWLALWTSADSLGGTIALDWDILWARSEDGGETWSAPRPLNGNAATDWGDDEDARLDTDGSGNWVAVWSSSDTLGNTIGGDGDILVARSGDGGKSWGPPSALNINAREDSGYDLSPSVASDGSDNWVAVWSSGESLGGLIGLDRDILVSRSGDGGDTWSAPAALNTNAGKDSRSDWSPSVAADAEGAWVVIWSSSDTFDGKLGMDRDIMVTRSTDAGAVWSDPEPLNFNADNDLREDSSPAVVTDGAGNWVAVWHSWDSFNEVFDVDADILLSHSSDKGANWSEPVTVNPSARKDDGDDVLPALATDGSGRWVAVWQAFEPSGGVIGGFDWDILASAGVTDPPASGR